MDRLKGKTGKILIILSSIVVPCSGHVMTGRPKRGLMMLLWMFALGYITFHLVSPEAPFLYKFSGGFVVWLFSIFEIISLMKKDN